MFVCVLMYGFLVQCTLNRFFFLKKKIFGCPEKGGFLLSSNLLRFLGGKCGMK